MTANKKFSVETLTGVITIALTVLGVILFFLGFSTGYYIFGEMQSTTIAALLGGAVILEIFTIIALNKWPGEFWPKILTFGVTAMLVGAAMLLVGDRVEGIGNCIVTDYDSGHGGEEAIYFSLGGVVAMLLGVIYNLIGSFFAPSESGEVQSAGKVKTIGFSASAAVLAVAALISSLSLAGAFGGSSVGRTPGGSNPSGTATAGGTYTVSYNANYGNAEVGIMPKYQFLCSDLSGMVRADSRFFVDIQLELDGEGNYTLFVDSYVKEGDYRSVIGDDTGLGMILTMNAEGTYTENDDGTYTTSVPTHAVFEMETDTYSSQMKAAAGMKVGDNDADGVYDSDTEPTVLDFVPETVWTLSGNQIVSYKDANLSGTYTISFNANNGNTDDMPDYQFICSDLSGMLRADSRFFIDISLDLDGNGGYTLFADAYVNEGGNRAVIGDDTGLGLILTMNAEGTYTENDDGTYTTSVPNHAVFEMETDTYSSQMKAAAGMKVGDNDADGVYDSNDEPAVLDFVPETVWTLDKIDGEKVIVSWYDPNADDEGEEGEDTGEPQNADSVTVPSDDASTAITFNADGTYKFAFEAYGVEDLGVYSYDGKTLTITNANGDEVTAEGDPLSFHYVTSISDQLAGDYTVAVADLIA